MSKTSRSELQHGSLYFTACRGYVSAEIVKNWDVSRNEEWGKNGNLNCLPYASPFVLSHFEYFTNFKTTPDAESIA